MPTSHALMGSVAEQVVRRAACPVIAVPHGTRAGERRIFRGAANNFPTAAGR